MFFRGVVNSARSTTGSIGQYGRFSKPFDKIKRQSINTQSVRQRFCIVCFFVLFSYVFFIEVCILMWGVLSMLGQSTPG
ncbi:hypothetical protein NIES4073_02570 (plasmid) [Kalymmatonema gypsitolerans NIES-4073]|nr:hypothetical protein NIES4073_02570 [Scytonema sp. NIES-4073]